MKENMVAELTAKDDTYACAFADRIISESQERMNILIMNCSPVRNGATAEIVKLVGQYVKHGNEVRTICIDDYDIRFCRGCKKCHQTAKCFQDDDVTS